MNKFADTGASRARRRHAIAMSIALAAGLAACGGNDAPYLAVQATATSAVASGQAVALHADLVGASDTPTWSLSGPGSLSATTGTDVNYLPPDAESFDDAATVTITVSAGGRTQQAQIALAAANVAGHHWSIAHAPGSQWTRVAWADGVFVAVGLHGGIASSRDGVNWVRHDTAGAQSWMSVVRGDGQWLALGRGGELLASVDGTTWTTPAPPLLPPDAAAAKHADRRAHPAIDIGTALTELVFGNGVYIATGGFGVSFSSPDGVNWTAARAPTSIAFGDDRFVAPDYGGVDSSVDGTTWTTAPGSPAAYLDPDIAFGNGRFIIQGEHLVDVGDLVAASYASTDGATWTPSALAPNWGSGLDFAAGSFYSLGTGLYASADGASWRPVDIDGDTCSSGVAASADMLVVVSPLGAIHAGVDAQHLGTVVAPSLGALVAVDRANGHAVAFSDDGDAFASQDGKTWTHTLAGGSVYPFAPRVAHAPDGTFVTAMQSSSSTGSYRISFQHSADGRAWTPSPDSPPGVIGALLHDGTRFIAIDSQGTVLASADGASWAELSSFSAPYGVFSAAFGGGRYVAVGHAGIAATSTDGVHWTTGPVAVDGAPGGNGFDFTGVAYDGRRFVAVGAAGFIATSADGLTWQAHASATTQTLSAIAVSPGGELIAVGPLGVVESSVDAVHWTLRTPASSQGLGAVHADADGFIAVGEDGLVEASTH